MVFPGDVGTAEAEGEHPRLGQVPGQIDLDAQTAQSVHVIIAEVGDEICDLDGSAKEAEEDGEHGKEHAAGETGEAHQEGVEAEDHLTDAEDHETSTHADKTKKRF